MYSHNNQSKIEETDFDFVPTFPKEEATEHSYPGDDDKQFGGSSNSGRQDRRQDIDTKYDIRIGRGRSTGFSIQDSFSATGMDIKPGLESDGIDSSNSNWDGWARQGQVPRERPLGGVAKVIQDIKAYKRTLEILPEVIPKHCNSDSDVHLEDSIFILQLVKNYRTVLDYTEVALKPWLVKCRELATIYGSGIADYYAEEVQSQKNVKKEINNGDFSQQAYFTSPPMQSPQKHSQNTYSSSRNGQSMFPNDIDLRKFPPHSQSTQSANFNHPVKQEGIDYNDPMYNSNAPPPEFYRRNHIDTHNGQDPRVMENRQNIGPMQRSGQSSRFEPYMYEAQFHRRPSSDPRTSHHYPDKCQQYSQHSPPEYKFQPPDVECKIEAPNSPNFGNSTQQFVNPNVPNFGLQSTMDCDYRQQNASHNPSLRPPPQPLKRSISYGDFKERDRGGQNSARSTNTMNARNPNHPPQRYPSASCGSASTSGAYTRSQDPRNHSPPTPNVSGRIESQSARAVSPEGMTSKAETVKSPSRVPIRRLSSSSVYQDKSPSPLKIKILEKPPPISPAKKNVLANYARPLSKSSPGTSVRSFKLNKLPVKNYAKEESDPDHNSE